MSAHTPWLRTYPVLVKCADEGIPNVLTRDNTPFPNALPSAMLLPPTFLSLWFVLIKKETFHMYPAFHILDFVKAVIKTRLLFFSLSDLHISHVILRINWLECFCFACHMFVDCSWLIRKSHQWVQLGNMTVKNSTFTAYSNLSRPCTYPAVRNFSTIVLTVLDGGTGYS